VKIRERGLGLSDLLSLVRMLRDVKSLADQSDELVSLMGGALVLADPIFVILVGISTLVTLLLALIAVITLCIYLF